MKLGLLAEKEEVNSTEEKCATPDSDLSPQPSGGKLDETDNPPKCCNHAAPPSLKPYWLLLVGIALLAMSRWTYATVHYQPLDKDGKVDENFQKSNVHIEDVLGRLVPHFNNSELLFATLDLQDEQGIKLMVQSGSQLNGRNGQLETPLIRAAVLLDQDKELTLTIVKFLIDHGADVFAQDDKGQTFLHKLVSLDNWGTKLTPSEFHELAEYLVSKKLAGVFNIPENVSGSTPLMWALTNLEVTTGTLSLLHMNGVDFSLEDKHGNSLFYDALVGRRDIGLFSHLKELGMDWKHLNVYNHSMVHLAANVGYVEGLKYFLGLGLDINFRDGFESTPLHQVAYYGTKNALETARFLIQNGAKVDIKGSGGSTPLDYVVKRGDGFEDKDEIIQLLRDNGGSTEYDFAFKRGDDSSDGDGVLAKFLKDNQ